MTTPAGARRDCRETSPQMTFSLIYLFVFFAVCQRKKKTITDVLSTSEPKPGCAADLQKTLAHYFSDKRSVIEQEELKLPGESEPFPILTPTFTCYILMCSFITPAVRSPPLSPPPPSDSCFLSSNDMTHTLSSYLKQGECCF